MKKLSLFALFAMALAACATDKAATTEDPAPVDDAASAPASAPADTAEADPPADAEDDGGW